MKTTLKNIIPMPMKDLKTANTGKKKPGYKTLPSTTHAMDHGKKC